MNKEVLEVTEQPEAVPELTAVLTINAMLLSNDEYRIEMSGPGADSAVMVLGLLTLVQNYILDRTPTELNRALENMSFDLHKQGQDIGKLKKLVFE